MGGFIMWVLWMKCLGKRKGMSVGEEHGWVMYVGEVGV